MFKCRLHDKDGILRKTMEMSRFSDYISVPEREIRSPLQEDTGKNLNVVGIPLTSFQFSHIIDKDAYVTELYYAEK